MGDGEPAEGLRLEPDWEQSVVEPVELFPTIGYLIGPMMTAGEATCEINPD